MSVIWKKKRESSLSKFPRLMPIACNKYGLASKKCTKPTPYEWEGLCPKLLSISENLIVHNFSFSAQVIVFIVL